jgi:hypothetical protein
VPGVTDGSGPAAIDATHRRRVVVGSPSHAADGNPVVCESNSRTVMASLPPRKAGRYFETGSSSERRPSSTKVMSVADVNHLLAEAIGITVCAVVRPTVNRCNSRPSRTARSTPPESPSPRTRVRIAVSTAA